MVAYPESFRKYDRFSLISQEANLLAAFWGEGTAFSSVSGQSGHVYKCPNCKSLFAMRNDRVIIKYVRSFATFSHCRRMLTSLEYGGTSIAVERKGNP
jgi:hypothetical protein